jgi:hypothetical protein
MGNVVITTDDNSMLTMDKYESLLSGYNSNRFNWLAESSKSFWEPGG